MITSIVWALCFVCFALLAFNRPIFGVVVYLQTFYLAPTGWWWGKQFMLVSITGRWNFIATMILLVAVTLDAKRHHFKLDKTAKTVFALLAIYAINGVIVHYTSASNPHKSYAGLELLWKHIGLCLLLYFAIQKPSDIKILFYTILLCSFYIGYEVVINERGGVEHGRLEGIFIPGAAESNYLAGLLCLTIPIGASLIFIGQKKDRVLAFCTLPFIFDVILRCTSRGAFLALLAGGIDLFVAARGPMRRYAIWGTLLTVMAVSIQAKDSDIGERFWSIFVPVEDLDKSATSRIDFTKAGWKMAMDYPFGSGAEAAFKSKRGAEYIRHLGYNGRQRAVHNGYIDILCGWGFQGFILYGLAIFFAWRALRKTVTYNLKLKRIYIAFLGVTIESALITQFVASAFISSLDGEWFFWLMAIMMAYARIYGPRKLIESQYIPDDGQGSMLDQEHRASSTDPFEDNPEKNAAL